MWRATVFLMCLIWQGRTLAKLDNFLARNRQQRKVSLRKKGCKNMMMLYQQRLVLLKTSLKTFREFHKNICLKGPIAEIIEAQSKSFPEKNVLQVLWGNWELFWAIFQHFTQFPSHTFTSHFAKMANFMSFCLILL